MAKKSLRNIPGSILETEGKKFFKYIVRPADVFNPKTFKKRDLGKKGGLDIVTGAKKGFSQRTIHAFLLGKEFAKTKKEAKRIFKQILNETK